MSNITLSHLDTAFPDYDFVWNLVDNIITADPYSTVRLLVCRSTACAKHIHNALRQYRYSNEFLIHLVPLLDEVHEERVEIVITKNFEAIE